MGWWASAFVLASVTAVATRGLVVSLAGPPSHLAIASAYVVPAAAVVAAVGWLASRPLRYSWILPAIVIVLAVAVRVVTALLLDAPLTGENRAVHQQASDILTGATNCCFSHRPTGYPLALAGAYALVGIGPLAIEAVNVACAAVTTWLVYDIGRTAWSPRVGLIGSAIYAVMPSQVLMALPSLTEPLYSVAVAGVVRIAVGNSARPLVAAALLGLAVALAQYVRSTAVSLLAPIASLPLMVGDGVRTAVAKGSLTVAAFLIAMLPVISFNLQAHGDLSLSTSAYAGWSLFVGANQESGGRFNQSDSAVFESIPGTSAWERSERAGELGVQRILDDPAGYLALQPRKFAVLWGDESYAGAHAFNPAGAGTEEAAVVNLASQLFYVPVVGLAVVAVLSDRRNPRPALLFIGMLVALVAVTHAFLEVHSRYHAYVVPLLVILAAGGVDAVVRRFRMRSLESGL